MSITKIIGESVIAVIDANSLTGRENVAYRIKRDNGSPSSGGVCILAKIATYSVGGSRWGFIPLFGGLSNPRYVSESPIEAIKLAATERNLIYTYENLDDLGKILQMEY